MENNVSLINKLLITGNGFSWWKFEKGLSQGTEGIPTINQKIGLSPTVLT